MDSNADIATTQNLSGTTAQLQGMDEPEVVELADDEDEVEAQTVLKSQMAALHNGDAQKHFSAPQEAAPSAYFLQQNPVEDTALIRKEKRQKTDSSSTNQHTHGVLEQDKFLSPSAHKNQLKRYKYDVLKSFFRVYFRPAPGCMVLKDSIYNLYCAKTEGEKIARNALYRQMWTHFKEDNISSFQSNYRDYIKGLQLNTSVNTIQYDSFEKDMEILRASGVKELFDFSVDEDGTIHFLSNAYQHEQQPQEQQPEQQQQHQAFNFTNYMLAQLKQKKK